MQCRKPVVNGQFYPSDRASCMEEINLCLNERKSEQPFPGKITAAIVPHAGWTFSGALAAMVFSAIKKRNKDVDTFVIFGAAHGYMGRKPAVYNRGCWLTPLGGIEIDESLADSIAQTETADINPDVHNTEHSIEVQIPFIQHLFGEAKIVPVIVPPASAAVELGEAVGRMISGSSDKDIVCVASTDLTHYGLRYGFTPAGIGEEGIKWAAEVNDKSFIDLAVALKPQELLDSSIQNCSSCGPGAAAAVVAVAKEAGIRQGTLLCYTNSSEVLIQKMGSSSHESVGYAAIVF